MLQPRSDSLDSAFALSRSIHSRMNGRQCLSAPPLASMAPRNVTASPSIRSRPLRSSMSDALSPPSAPRRASRSSASIRPLRYKTSPSFSATRSTLKVMRTAPCGKPQAVETCRKRSSKHSGAYRVHRDSREFRECRDFRDASAELELALSDLEGLDLGFEGRGGNAELRCRTCWASDAATAFGQGGFDHLTFAA